MSKGRKAVYMHRRIRMKWEAFILEVKRLLAEKIEDDEKVKIQEVPKNNGVILTGVCIVKKGGRITPTIYLDDFYQNYLNGAELEDIANVILKKHRSLQDVDGTDLQFFGDFEEVKKRIVFRLVNLERNKKRLKDMPYMQYLDLAIVFYCHVSMDEGSHAAIPVYKRHMKMWNVEKEELLKLAKRNTQKIFPCELIPMEQMVSEMLQEIELDEENMDNILPVPMFILTNIYRLNGATTVLYKNVLDDFAKACNGDFYLLPSSIHEVILIPAKECSSFEEMTNMVREVNETQVEAEELLADHAYYYSREEKKLIIPKSEQ